MTSSTKGRPPAAVDRLDPSWPCPYKTRKLKRLILWDNDGQRPEIPKISLMQFPANFGCFSKKKRMLSQPIPRPTSPWLPLGSYSSNHTLSLCPGKIFTKFRDIVTVGPTMCHSTISAGNMFWEQFLSSKKRPWKRPMQSLNLLHPTPGKPAYANLPFQFDSKYLKVQPTFFNQGLLDENLPRGHWK